MSARHAGLLALLAAIWGGSYLLIKYALEGFSPAMVVFGRTLLGAGVLYAVIRAQGAEPAPRWATCAGDRGSRCCSGCWRSRRPSC